MINFQCPLLESPLLEIRAEAAYDRAPAMSAFGGKADCHNAGAGT
jgi:hypothetical protein